MKKTTIVGVIALLAFALICIGIYRKNFHRDEGQTMRIACNLPMTGDLAFYGEEISSSVKMLMDEKKDSLKSSKINIVYDFQDNSGAPKSAVAVFQNQNVSGFDIYMSGVTAQTAAIVDQVKESKKPHFVWSFMPFQLTENQNTFRTWVDLAFEGQCFLKYIDSVKPKSVAFLYQNISSTQEQFNKILGPRLKEKGISVVMNEAYDVSTMDFKNVMIKLKQLNPDITIIYGFKPNLIEIIKGLNLNKIKKDGNILCSFDFLDVQNAMDPDMLDGIVTNVPAYVLDTSGRLNAWRNKFQERYKRIPLFTDAYAYDCANIIFDASKRYFAQKNQNLTDVLLTTDIEGLTGKLAFSNTGELKYNVKICKYINGRFSILQIK